MAGTHRMLYEGPNLIGDFANTCPSATTKRGNLIKTLMGQTLGQPAATLAKKQWGRNFYVPTLDSSAHTRPFYVT